MKIGILGGTFDPIHEGHLALAEAACRQLKLDRVFFVPAAVSPFKTGQTRGAAADDRLAMLQLALQGFPAFEISRWELEQGGVSYTADTLRHFRKEFPQAEIFLLMGEDTFNGLQGWKEPEMIRKLARLAVAPRSAGRTPLKTPASDSGVFWLDMPLCGASSSACRSESRILPGVPAAVKEYIRSRGLYGNLRP